MLSVPSSNPLLRLHDIVKNCERIFSYTNGMDDQTFISDERTKDAVERCLSRISEAAYQLGNRYDDLIPKAHWAGARGIDNILRHQYDQMKDSDIWEAIIKDQPPLGEAATNEIARLSHNNDVIE